MHCFYYIQYCKVFKGFFSFLFSLCFFHAKDIFSSQLLLIIITSSPRGGRGLCFKWLLEITKLFHTHTGRRNSSGPPNNIFFFYIPTIPTQALGHAEKTKKNAGCGDTERRSFLLFPAMTAANGKYPPSFHLQPIPPPLTFSEDINYYWKWKI